MDKLKSFIDNNRDAFDDVPLPEGHWERFEKKLPGKNSNRIKRYSLIGLVAVASVVLFLFLTLPAEWVEDKFQMTADVCENQQEMEELKMYYEMQIYNVVSRMENIKEDSDSPLVAGLMEASQQVLSGNNRFEKTVLPGLPCSDDGLFVVNQHYSTSLQSLRRMLDQMEQYTSNNNN